MHNMLKTNNPMGSYLYSGTPESSLNQKTI